MSRKLLTVLISLLYLGSSAQTVKFNSEEAFNGYTLLNTGNTTYLMNNCGELVNEWSPVRPNFHSKLLPNGNLVYITRSNSIQELDWDGNEVYEVFNPLPDSRLVYEVIKMDNGNLLAIARILWTPQQFIDLGYELSFTNPERVDIVVEIDPGSGELVWMWNITDHVIQERDPDANNYGSVKDNPQLLNMDAISTFDWTSGESFMINSFDYNPELDQIALSVRKMSEIVIIDHSTTTQEASGSTGGRYGKGGDILYRWGNPQNYGRGTADDRQLYFQHNPNWIKHGEHKGKIMVFNNGLSRDVDRNDRYSSVPIINPPIDSQGNYMLDDSLAYLPESPEIELGHPDPDPLFYSGYTSGAVMLPNGNTFVTIGADDELLELNPEGDIVWFYPIPIPSYIYRAEKYPEDYPAFQDRDLAPFGLIPGDIDINCDLFVSINEPTESSGVLISHSMESDELRIRNAQGMYFSIYGVNGIRLSYGRINQEDEKIPFELTGLGVITVYDRQGQLQKTFKFVSL